MKNTAIIIGASGQIGEEIAQNLAKKGYNLALTYNENKIDNTKFISEDVDVKTYHLNLTQKGTIKEFFEQVNNDFDYITTLVFAAGIAQKRKLVLDATEEEIDNLFDINTKAAILCIKEFCKKLNHPANVVLIGSFVEKFGCSCESVYVASKAALTGLCKSLATELGVLDVRINVVAPGFIDTKMNNNLSESEKEDIADMTPLKRLGTAIDVANAVAFLSSEDASFITGQTLFVDGGLILE